MTLPTADNFNDNSFNSSVWSVIQDGGGTSSYTEQNERLEFSATSDNASVFGDAGVYVYQGSLSSPVECTVKLISISGTIYDPDNHEAGMYFLDEEKYEGEYLRINSSDTFPIYLKVYYDLSTYELSYSYNEIDWVVVSSGINYKCPGFRIGLFIDNDGDFTNPDSTLYAYFDDFTVTSGTVGTIYGVECYNTFGQETFSSVRYKSARVCDTRTLTADTSGSYSVPVGYADYVDSSDLFVTAYSLSETGIPLDVKISSTTVVSGIRYATVLYDYDNNSYSYSGRRQAPTGNTVAMIMTE